MPIKIAFISTQEVLLSPKNFWLGAFWYPHWENIILWFQSGYKSILIGIVYIYGVSWPSGLVCWTHGSGVVRMWVRILAWPVAALVSLSKTLNHNCFVLRMGRKAVGPVCCVMHVKEPRTLAPVFLEWQQNAPKSCALWSWWNSTL